MQKNTLTVNVEILKASNLSNSNLEIGWLLIKNSKQADLAVASLYIVEISNHL